MTDYDKINEMIQTAKSLSDLRDAQDGMEKASISKSDREDIGELFLIQWGALGGTLNELE